MNFLDLVSTGGVLKKLETDEMLKSNQITKNYGLQLTLTEVQEIIETRNRAVQSSGRIELGTEIPLKIIRTFYASSFICLEDYAYIISELVAIFYHMKNETEDLIGDDELINIMKDFFDGSCKGSLTLLKNREMIMFARDFRKARQKDDFLRKEDHGDEP
ncbi:MAG: DUF6323 family protein [Syntrophomonas sp.]